MHDRERRRRHGERRQSKALGGSLGRRPRFPSLVLAREDSKHFGSGGDVLQNCADKRIGVKRVRTETEKNPFDVTSAATESPARIRPGAVAGCEQQGAALRQLL